MNSRLIANSFEHRPSKSKLIYLVKVIVVILIESIVRWRNRVGHEYAGAQVTYFLENKCLLIT